MDRIIEKKKWTTKKILISISTIVFVVFTAYTFIFSSSTSKLNVDLEKITISEVREGGFEEFIPVNGTVEPIKTFYLDVTEGGRIVEKFVEEGAFLELGDPIIRLENAQVALNIMYNEANVYQQLNYLRTTRLQMETNKLSLKGQLLRLTYQIKNLKREFDLKQKLYEKKLASKIEFENARDNYLEMVKTKELTVESIKTDSVFQTKQIEQLEFQVSQMQERLEMSKRQLDNLTVRAPIAGQLTSLRGDIGQTISRGQNLGRIDKIDQFKIRTGIDEYYINRIVEGLEGRFQFDNKEFKAVIKTIYPEVDQGRFFVDMVFTDEIPEGIRRGQTIHLKLTLGNLSEAVLVDVGGFYQSTGGRWAFIISSDGSRAVKRDIKIGRKNTEEFEVLGGLKPGEKIITSSYDNFGEVEELILN